VHRDLKPRNVMLSPDGPKVIDFGVAGAVDRETLLGFGTPGWLAPEQLAGQAGGTAADVFAWGLLVTWAGTGLHPARFRPDPERLPAALRPLVRAALAVDPGARPTAADLVRRCGLRPPTTRPTGTTGPIGATVPIGTTSASHASVPVDTTGPTRATGPSHPTAPIGTTGSSHPDRPRTIPGHPTRRRHPTGPSYATRATRATHLRPVPTSRAQPAPPVGPPPRVRPPRRRLRIGGRLVTLALLTALLVAGWQLTGRYGQSRAGTAAPTGAASQPAAPPQPGRGGGGQATAADRTPAARPDNRDVTPVPPRTYTAARADTARAGGLAFTLTGMRCGEPEVGSWPVRRAATGRYCRVDLKVANTGDHAGFVFAGSQELTDAGGQRHTADNWAWVYEAGARAFTAPLEAGDSVTGTLVFDVPADATFTALTLYDTPLSRGTAIALH
jgi:hypothetical protein